jgi:hypothetical protein
MYVIICLFTTLLTHKVKSIKLGMATYFDHGSHPQAIQLSQKCKHYSCTTLLYSFFEILTACVKLPRVSAHIQGPPKKCIHTLTKENSALYN